MMHRLLLLGLLASSAPALATPVPLYRLYSSRASDHFYTTSWPEALNAITHHGYTFENTVGLCHDSNEAGTTPLFRLYSGRAGDHFYTASVEERDLAVATHGYVSEGVACYVFPSNQAGACPLIRLWNGTDHFYTLSMQEAINSRYTYEGIAGYIFAPGGGGCPH
ncbi:hypothetical protein LZ198_22245 [Myxococcus sp. K15C18031901]|uniref:hypothetical protein n=1 Tax=Myxococcus dinghuensis TaxID=2906761 RepID=UPI0020A7D1C6|nr:hypothetical protein [Myxococcus dinghuensis]MCP3101601.1 hypothetical protein [Myxococcus dinghuensis]